MFYVLCFIYYLVIVLWVKSVHKIIKIESKYKFWCPPFIGQSVSHCKLNSRIASDHRNVTWGL